MEIEEFRDIPDYEGLYQVSNFGNVKSLKRYRVPNDRVLLPVIDNSGYAGVNLSKNGNCVFYKIHYLVSVTFLNHKRDGHNMVIDHINNIRTDNRLENLQLISNRENASKDRTGSSKYTGVSWDRFRCKWVSQMYINGNAINLGRFKSEIEASQIYQLALKNIEKYNGNNKEFRELLKSHLIITQSNVECILN